VSQKNGAFFSGFRNNNYEFDAECACETGTNRFGGAPNPWRSRTNDIKRQREQKIDIIMAEGRMEWICSEWESLHRPSASRTLREAAAKVAARVARVLRMGDKICKIRRIISMHADTIRNIYLSISGSMIQHMRLLIREEPGHLKPLANEAREKA